MKRIKKGDQIVVISGKDKGRKGTILQVLDAQHVLVESINVSKKHQRPNPQKNQPGGIVEKEMPLHISKVAIWNPAASKADRVGFKTLTDGKRVRIFKSNGEVLDV
jgi:large subunit ribosomal protein L24